MFSLPECAGGQLGKTWLNAGAHLVLGLTIGPLLVLLVGCVINVGDGKSNSARPGCGVISRLTGVGDIKAGR